MIRTCRGVVDLLLTEDNFGLKPTTLSESQIVRCGKPATKYQEGCANPEDGWSCDECYMDPEEFAQL